MFDPTIYSQHLLTSTSTKPPINPGNNFDLPNSNVLLKQNSLPPEETSDLETIQQQYINSGEIEISEMRQSSVDNSESNSASPTPKITRKISRFLVSPVVVPGSIDGENKVVGAEQKMVADSSTIVPSSISQIDLLPDQVSQLTLISPNLQSNNNQSVTPRYNESTTAFQTPTPNISSEGDANNDSINKFRMGPEIVNTLEQLKIELENITHAHVPTVKVAKDNLVNQTSNADSVTRNSLATQNSISEATQTSSTNTVGSLASLEEYKNYPVAEDASAHPSLDIPPANEFGQEVATSISDNSNIYNLSQNTSVYNSRRTSTDLESSMIDQLESNLLKQKLANLSTPNEVSQGSPLSTLDPITCISNTMGSSAASSPQVEMADQAFSFQNAKNAQNILSPPAIPLQQHQTVLNQSNQNILKQQLNQQIIGQPQQQIYQMPVQNQQQPNFPPNQQTPQNALQHQQSIGSQQSPHLALQNVIQQNINIHQQPQLQQALSQNILSNIQPHQVAQPQQQQIVIQSIPSNSYIAESNVPTTHNLALNIPTVPTSATTVSNSTNNSSSQFKISNIVDLEHELSKLHQKKTINDQGIMPNTTSTPVATPPLQLTPNIDSSGIIPLDNSQPLLNQPKPQTTNISRFKVSMVTDSQAPNNAEQIQTHVQPIERSCSLSSSSSSTSSNASSSSSSTHSSITSNIRKPSTENQLMENVDGIDHINIQTAVNVQQAQQTSDFSDMLLKLPESIKLNVKQKRNDLNAIFRGTNDPATRHGIQLLIQRQLLEEQELILKHHKELENFIKTVKGNFFCYCR